MKKIFNIPRETLVKIFTATIAMVIILDCDLYLYPFFQAINIPLPSTILTFIWLPILILMVFFSLEKDKKKIFISAIILGIVYGTYFLLHHLITKDLAPVFKATDNFYYDTYQEIIYFIKMLLPLLYIYVIYKLDMTIKEFERMIIIICCLISIPILVSNIFTCSPSTYEGWTKANLFTWFNGIYDIYTPREISTSFFFSMGNTTGMVLFMTYPILLNINAKKNMSLPLTILVVIQGLAMYCLATRVASYGVVIMLIAYLFIYLFCVLLKKIEFSKKVLFIYLIIGIIFMAILPFSPAYINQQINNQNNGFILEDEELRREIRGSIYADELDLDPESQEYKNYWSYIFKQYYFFLSIPKEYFMDYYYYKFDPKFWVDVIFEYDFYDRDSGRDFENIFTQYKWQNLSPKQKLFGTSFSIPMEGSIVIEQDFVSQYYTHGPIGAFLLCSPWVIGLIIVTILAIKKFKDVIGTDILTIGLAYVGGLFAAYSSGHLLAEIFGSLLLASLLAMLLKMVIKKQD